MELRKPQLNRFCSFGLEILQMCDRNRLHAGAPPTGDETLTYDSSAEEVV